ncbi:hypothetical protein TYRP_003594 [Tyrophagus putrescentiae]|nr:hypothetical protein TYRP_003594 [Tyrophagus putrescentiae]
MKKPSSSFSNAKLAWEILLGPVIGHFAALHQQMDPIEELAPGQRFNPQKSNLNRQFLVPLVVVLFTTVYGLVGFQLEAGLPLTIEALQESPVIFTHQVVLPAIWRQMDFALGLDIVIAVGVYAMMLRTASVRPQYRIFMINFEGGGPSPPVRKVFIGRQELPAELLPQRLFSDLEVGLAAFLVPPFPLYMFYIVYALFGTILFTMLACKYIRMRQRDVCCQFTGLIAEVEGRDFQKRRMTLEERGVVVIMVNKGRVLKFRGFSDKEEVDGSGGLRRGTIWRRYLLQNLRLVATCRMVREYNRFCWPLLSVLFPYYILVQCYLAYAVFFTPIPPLIAAIFYIAISEVNLFLFFIIRQCARVHQYNGQMEAANRTFYFRFLVSGGFQVARAPAMVKAQFFFAHQRLLPYTFKLANLYMITTKTYHVIISYISIFFMYLVKSK